jgi:hypothetical protein
MDNYEVLLNHYRIGSEISGTVIARDEPALSHGMVFGNITLQTEAPYRVLLPYWHLVDEPSSYSTAMIQPIGARVRAVVFNFVDGTLWLSARPKDFSEATISRWKGYYNYIESLTIGSSVKGTVKSVRPFGLFVDIGGPFIGLIEICCCGIHGAMQLPFDYADWPKEGDEIRCVIVYFRLHNQQIGLGWLPASGAEPTARA